LACLHLRIAYPLYVRILKRVSLMGFLLFCARQVILTAVEKMRKGEFFVTSGVGPKRLEKGADPARVAASLRLSSRERETLQLVAEGRSTKEVAHVLNISDISLKTVAFRKDNVKRKFGLWTADQTCSESRLNLVVIRMQ